MAEIGRNINLAYEAGYRDQEIGGLLCDNPYKAGGASWTAYRTGWTTAWKERPGGVEWSKKYGQTTSQQLFQ